MNKKVYSCKNRHLIQNIVFIEDYNKAIFNGKYEIDEFKKEDRVEDKMTTMMKNFLHFSCWTKNMATEEILQMAMLLDNEEVEKMITEEHQRLSKMGKNVGPDLLKMLQLSSVKIEAGLHRLFNQQVATDKTEVDGVFDSEKKKLYN